ncbi:MAG: 2-amino-4-hydroxy-6-hydroxymethyldihydropteridine diphosphokinase [Planctomycetaceae bacterium]|nr:2-amino-4-hydroxy-6-hydroxymethyldihydropteridine diphosphokinase [Planctomycetaceae bacterium]
MPDCYLSLGGNSGDVFASMERGLEELDRTPGVWVRAVSPVYSTAPVGTAPEDGFLNAAARFESTRTPFDLLQELHRVEDLTGRRRVQRWGPRPLDLDLLLFGDAISSRSELFLPHPHLWYRRFVLDPLADIAADIRHPLLGVTIRELKEQLEVRPLPVVLIGGERNERGAIIHALSASFPSASVGDDFDEESVASAAAIVLDLNDSVSRDSNVETDAERAARCHTGRVIRLRDLPGTNAQAAVSVLTAALDTPSRHKRPLRSIP